ncbi:DMT family transporter [Ancylobacter sp. G4_0304]|uniref:DMT family transporter n=1 Tax=Ancylobacter sp. G4_0304 TaxID=3114289 RepID=UPI0039C6CAF1
MKPASPGASPSRLPDSDDPRTRLTGIGLICVAFVLFTLLDTTVKWLNHTVHPLEIAWARYAGQFVLSFLVLNPWSTPGFWRTRRLGLQITRSLLLVGTTLGNFFALQYLQLDQTMSITFSTPFLVALFAGPLLGEWIGVHRWLAIMVGFAGILIIVQPSTQGLHPAVLASLGGALCYAFYNISTRMLAATDSTATTMFYTSFVGTAVLTVPLPWFWSVPGEALVIGGLSLLGIFGGLGHLLVVMAHRRAPAAVLSPFLYTQMIWMMLSGWLIFHQTPDTPTLIGAGIVICSGLYLLWRERVRHATRSLEANLGE